MLVLAEFIVLLLAEVLVMLLAEVLVMDLTVEEPVKDSVWMLVLDVLGHVNTQESVVNALMCAKGVVMVHVTVHVNHPLKEKIQYLLESKIKDNE